MTGAGTSVCEPHESQPCVTRWGVQDVVADKVIVIQIIRSETTIAHFVAKTVYLTVRGRQMANKIDIDDDDPFK